ncbi:hypothetical protein [Streptomyces cinereoruber]|uniref:hypothetical protein n=1 Tax=Streptomyces cinereoruber TaxID=67260 RepID=UPI003634FD4C
MLVTLVTTALAILGTLLDAIVSGRFQERAAERAVRIGHGETIRRDRLGAVRPIMVLVRPFSKCRGRKVHDVLPGVCATPGGDLSPVAGARGEAGSDSPWRQVMR